MGKTDYAVYPQLHLSNRKNRAYLMEPLFTDDILSEAIVHLSFPPCYSLPICSLPLLLAEIFSSQNILVYLTLKFQVQRPAEELAHY